MAHGELAAEPRPIVLRTRGRVHGPVRRLASPGDIGAMIKPFLFLDLFTLDPASPARFGLHPHSGIATLTLLVRGEMHFLDRHGAASSQAAGGIEWMMAGGGVWHGSALTSAATASGFQLWVALPPELEEAPPKEMFVAAGDLPMIGPARVLLGGYGEATSPVTPPAPMTYLHVTLRPGERWRFVPPAGHDVAWIAVHSGTVAAPERVAAGALAVFEEGSVAIDLAAEGEEGCDFVLGSAVKHPHPLVVGRYSVHSNGAALARSEARVAQLGAELRRSGRLS